MVSIFLTQPWLEMILLLTNIPFINIRPVVRHHPSPSVFTVIMALVVNVPLISHRVSELNTTVHEFYCLHPCFAYFY